MLSEGKVNAGPAKLPPEQRAAEDTPFVLKAAGVGSSRLASEQDDLETRHAHGESVYAKDMAGDRSDDSQGLLLEGEVDTELADLPPVQCVAVDTPRVLEAAACDPREAGTRSELQTCDATSDHNSYGDAEHCLMLECLSALRFARMFEEHLAAFIEVSLALHG